LKHGVLANSLELNSGSVYSLNRRQERMCKSENICSGAWCPKSSSAQWGGLRRAGTEKLMRCWLSG